ncbi:MAG: response regulator [Bryobacteraceae bacterium]
MNQQTVRVLLIEDCPDYAGVVHDWLSALADEESAGFDLVWRQSLGEGLERVRDGGIDLVLLDRGLPDCPGCSLAAFRAAFPATPVIMLTGVESELDATRLLEDGAVDYLVKHICDAKTLRGAIWDFVENPERIRVVR